MIYSQEYYEEKLKGGNKNKRGNKVNRKKKTRSNEYEITMYQALQSMSGAYCKVNTMIFILSKYIK